MRCATLCNRAQFVGGQSNTAIIDRKVRGDASEEAILKYIEAAKPQRCLPQTYRNDNPKLIEIPFSSTTKYQVYFQYISNFCLHS